MPQNDQNDGNPQHPGKEVFNDRPEVGSVGKARSSGGASAAAFIKVGMPVLEADGTLLGTVESVERDRILIAGDPEGDFIPMSMVDGVDDARVILISRGDGSFGLGGTP